MSDNKEIVHFKVVGWVEEYAEFEELLIRFLCEQGVYFQFMSNIQKYPNYGSTIFEVFEYIKTSTHCFLGFIDAAICWSDTPEKGYYWYKVNQLFNEYYSNSEHYKKYHK